MKLIRIPMIALAAMLSTASFAAAADTAFPIKITRPSKAGTAYNVHQSIEATSSMNLTIPGQPPQAQNQTLAGDLAARCDVTEVDALGSEKTFFLTIQKFTTGADKKEVVPPGTIIDVKRTSKDATFTIRGGGTLSDDANHVLALLYSPLQDENGTDDDAYGSKTPRKVGESWSGNAEVAAKQAGDANVQVDPQKLTASTLLKGVETAQGVQALRLISTISVKDAKPNDLPPGFTVETSDIKTTVNGLLPTDLTLPPLETGQTMDIHMVCDGPAQSQVKMVIDSHIAGKGTYMTIKN